MLRFLDWIIPHPTNPQWMLGAQYQRDPNNPSSALYDTVCFLLYLSALLYAFMAYNPSCTGLVFW